MRREKEEGSAALITLTRLNRGPFLLNSDLIEHVEMTPDTVVNLTNGHQFMVLETAQEVVRRIVEFRRAIHQPPDSPYASPHQPDPAS
jgi:flagellar protein FlbD